MRKRRTKPKPKRRISKKYHTGGGLPSHMHDCGVYTQSSHCTGQGSGGAGYCHWCGGASGYCTEAYNNCAKALPRKKKRPISAPGRRNAIKASTNNTMIDFCVVPSNKNHPQCKDWRWGVAGAGTQRRGGKFRGGGRVNRGRKKFHSGGNVRPHRHPHSPGNAVQRPGPGLPPPDPRLNQTPSRYGHGGLTGCKLYTSKYDCEQGNCHWDFNDNCCH